MRIIVLDGHAVNPGDLSWAGLEALGDVEIYPRTAEDEILQRIAGAEAVITNKVPLTAETLRQAAPTLRYVGVTATGYNIVDTEAAAELGVCVTNVPAYSTYSVAQMVFAHLLNISNRVAHYSQAVLEEGRWAACPDYCFYDTPLFELAGRTMGIVGLGRIGSAVAAMARAFGMQVLAVTSKAQEDLPEGVKKVSLEEAFAQSDVVSLHCPLTPATDHMVGSYLLTRMKRGAILINTSRGCLIDEGAVALGLHVGHLGYYAADVMKYEPPTEGSPLFSAPRVQLTPHIAWATREARQRLMQATADNLEAWQRGEARNVVSL